MGRAYENLGKSKKHGDQASGKKLRVAPQAKSITNNESSRKYPQLRILDDQKEIDEKGIKAKQLLIIKKARNICEYAST